MSVSGTERSVEWDTLVIYSQANAKSGSEWRRTQLTRIIPDNWREGFSWTILGHLEVV